MSAAAPSTSQRFLDRLRPLERELEGYARRLCWDPEDVPDALQNAVLRAYRAFDRYREDASFRAWIYQILTREVFALNRRHARVARHEFQLDPEELAELEGPEVELEPTSIEPPAGTDPNLFEPEVHRALKTLTDTERAVLLQRALGGFRYREIAEQLAIPLGTVMGSLSRARQKMRLALAATRSHPPQPRSPHQP